MFELLGMGTNLLGLADIAQNQDDAADFFFFDHRDAEYLRHERSARTVIEAQVVANQGADALLGRFVERGKSLVANQDHVCFLTEDFFAGVPEQKFSCWIHLGDAQIRSKDDDTFFEIVGDGMLDLDNMPNIREGPLRAFEAVEPLDR